eukprot:CAMPEP_0172907792 /NCGR_PEP_ID=MMETSP1075-20121228/179534_1 /TAXON_ID=2916 /ORGANISM="Ceratium fusus, Strain PA161109" /LENGTH=35 /DNA_ID= /DNA_START= /DNA_END= /DNA_ORIENTATION=
MAFCVAIGTGGLMFVATGCGMPTDSTLAIVTCCAS